MNRTFGALAIIAVAITACSTQASNQADDDPELTLRNLTESNVAAPLHDSYPIEGRLIPTPSDRKTQYYLLRHRIPMATGTVVALIREETGDKAAYARVEVDCGKRLFRIAGVANRRSFAETSFKSDGPLRPLNGFPLRQEIATFVCERQGTPLA